MLAASRNDGGDGASVQDRRALMAELERAWSALEKEEAKREKDIKEEILRIEKLEFSEFY